MSMPATANTDITSAIAEAQARFTAANPNSQAQLEKASKVLPGGNTRTVLFYPPFPLTMTKGEGCHLWDLDGHQYIDFLGEYTAGLYGHSNPIIRAALDNALDNGIVMGGQNRAEARGHDLVKDQQGAGALGLFAQHGQEFRRGLNAAAATLHGFDNDAGQIRPLFADQGAASLDIVVGAHDKRKWCIQRRSTRCEIEYAAMIAP